MKKRTMRRCAAFLCAAVLLATSAFRTVYAQEEAQPVETGQEESVEAALTQEPLPEAEEPADAETEELFEEEEAETEGPGSEQEEPEAEGSDAEEEPETEEPEAEEEKHETEGSYEEEETEEQLFFAIAEDSIISEDELRSYDFSSKRLLVAGDIIDPENELSSYGGVHLMQYADAQMTGNAYSYYYGRAAFVFIDSVVTVADGNSAAVAAGSMTEDANPIGELAQAVAEYPDRTYDIALIDTGVNISTAGAVSMLGDDISDANGHGTKMAGLICEQDPGARILSIKALGADGTGDATAVYAAVRYAIEQNVSIINLSISAVNRTENALVKEAIEEAISAGITVVGAAGNSGTDATYFIPGCISSAVIIGACDEAGYRLASSNYGNTVDYYVTGNSTSEAAARYAGYLSAGKSGIDNILVFDGTGAPEEEPESGTVVFHYTFADGYAAADDQVVQTISFITTPLSYDFIGMGDGTNYSDQAFTITGGGVSGYNIGYCIEPNKHQPATGTYENTTVTRTTNEAFAKVLYYGCGGPGDITVPYGTRFSSIDGSDTSWQVRHALTHVVASRVAVEQGFVADNNYTRGLSAAGIAAAEELYSEIMSKPAPSGLTVYIATPSADEQTMIFVGEYNPVAAVTVVKSSAAPDITDGNSCYELQGAVYGLYADAACTAEAGRFTILSDGTSDQLEVSSGTYYIKEISAPRGYLPDISVHPVTLEAGTSQTVELADSPGLDPVGVLLGKVDENGEDSDTRLYV